VVLVEARLTFSFLSSIHSQVEVVGSTPSRAEGREVSSTSRFVYLSSSHPFFFLFDAIEKRHQKLNIYFPPSSLSKVSFVVALQPHQVPSSLARSLVLDLLSIFESRTGSSAFSGHLQFATATR